jgi:type III pantothenate kinase
VILDIDAGNTRIKWRIVDGDTVVSRGDQATQLNRQGLALEISLSGRIERIRVSCVAGKEIIENLHSQLSEQFDCQLEIAEVTESTGSIVCGYRDYSQLGVDRWLALVAAYAKNSDAVIVVDAGSAFTVDIVGSDGVHQGGYIVPGLRLMHGALWQGTERIKVETKPIADINSPGLDTGEAVDKGCLISLVAMIESLAAKYQSRVVITGGDALLIRDALKVDTELCPDLVLDGLAVEGVGLRVVER